MKFYRVEPKHFQIELEVHQHLAISNHFFHHSSAHAQAPSHGTSRCSGVHNITFLHVCKQVWLETFVSPVPVKLLLTKVLVH